MRRITLSVFAISATLVAISYVPAQEPKAKEPPPPEVRGERAPPREPRGPGAGPRPMRPGEPDGRGPRDDGPPPREGEPGGPRLGPGRGPGGPGSGDRMFDIGPGGPGRPGMRPGMRGPMGFPGGPGMGLGGQGDFFQEDPEMAALNRSDYDLDTQTQDLSEKLRSAKKELGGK